ncbi:MULTISPECIES: BatA domain-containing protein [Luteimonas]|uniref:BatA domain-containing protein n=1 Tax=Luteimonas TaxID=83614 RepID=UPI000C799A25|nr:MULTISPECIES: BatA domain-containing protein [Luteimonas]
MNLALLLPLGLAALLAWAIPLLLHLARRTEQRPTSFAALRWLRQKPRPRRRLRFDDWPLLLVRLLLLALLALWLAQPVRTGDVAPAHWVAVVPGVDPAAVPFVADDDVELRWLAPGFPMLDVAPSSPELAAASVSSLLRQLDAELPASARLTVVTPAVLDGVDARRIALSRLVDWQVQPGPDEAGDAGPDLRDPAPPALQVRIDDAHAAALPWLRAAAIAWHAAPDAAPAIASAPTQAPPASQDEVLVWLRADALPPPVVDWIAAGGTALLASDTPVEAASDMRDVWNDAAGRPVLRASVHDAGRVFRFAQPLTAEAMPSLLSPAFPRELRAQLQPLPSPARVRAVDHAPDTGARAYPTPPRDLQPWLAIAIALLCLLERWMATARRRVVAS